MKYTVRYDRDESGHWIATVPKVRGCHTYGRSIEEARRRIREALGLFVSNADRAELVDDVRLPAPAQALVRAVARARSRARSHEARAAITTERAVRTMRNELRLSARDTGQLLGLSHQRVHQLTERRRPSKEKRA